MFNLKRNQIIITVLIFMIAVAAYLNTQNPMDHLNNKNVAANTTNVTDTTNQPEEVDFFAGYDEQLAKDQEVAKANVAAKEDVKNADVANSDEADKQAQLAAAKPDELALSDATGTEKINAVITKKQAIQDEGVAASKNLEVSYFAEEKLLREQSRAQQVEQLTEFVANENLDQEAKAKAAANLIEIQERIEKETSAEALLKAKGFEEVYVRIDDDTVDVVVNKAELTDTEIAQIEEIVNRKTGYSIGKINITPLNGVAKK